MSDELKPCPFCGSTNINCVDLAGFEVWCTDCGAMAGACDYTFTTPQSHTKESAIAAWNRRHTQTSPDPRQPVAHVCDQAGGAST